MTPSTAPTWTVATIGHPESRVGIIKSEDGWRYIQDPGGHVDPEDFRAGWNFVSTPDAAKDLTEAIRLTQEYVGPETLPPIEGWSWYDALVKYAPEAAEAALVTAARARKATS